MIGRRAFLTAIAGTMATRSAAQAQTSTENQSTPTSPPGSGPSPRMVWTLFSRNVQWLVTADYARTRPYDTGVMVGEKARELGFSALDLTVRHDGLVDPSRDDLAANLPAMLKGIRSTSVRCDQITTNVELADRPVAVRDGSQVYPEDLLKVASANGVRLYRWGGFAYDVKTLDEPRPFGREVQAQLRAFSGRASPLATLNRRYGMTALYHTFSGGAGPRSVWDLMALLEPYSASELAINFDIGHMTCEGALSAWDTNLRYAMPRVLGVALKDAEVFRTPNGEVGGSFPPAGQGLVQWATFFKLLHEGGFNGPAQAQYEFEVTGLKGRRVSFNNTFWADHAEFAQGNLSAAFATRAFRREIDFYKDQAKNAGWPDDQLG